MSPPSPPPRSAFASRHPPVPLFPDRSPVVFIAVPMRRRVGAVEPSVRGRVGGRKPQSGVSNGLPPAGDPCLERGPSVSSRSGRLWKWRSRAGRRTDESRVRGQSEKPFTGAWNPGSSLIWSHPYRTRWSRRAEATFGVLKTRLSDVGHAAKAFESTTGARSPYPLSGRCACGQGFEDNDRLPSHPTFG